VRREDDVVERGERVVGGQRLGLVQSMPAPPSAPARSASTRASVSITPPRAVLTTIASSRIRASSAAPIMPRVSSVSGVWTDSTCERSSSSSRLTCVTPRNSVAPSGAAASYPMTS